MTAIVPLARSDLLGTRDYEIVIDSVMRPSGEAEWSHVASGGAHEPHRDSPTIWWAFNRADTSRDERGAQLAKLATAMLAATTQFALASCLRPFEQRLSALEVRCSSIEALGLQSASASALAEGARAVREANEHLDVILTQFESAFGGVRPHATLVPLFGEDGHMLRLVLNASDADPALLSRTREAGGRARFIDALAHSIPASLFREIDLAFVFANEG